MKKIEFKFEETYAGKKDVILKEIDCDFQAGNIAGDDTGGLINIIDAIALSFIHFLQKIDIDVDVFKADFDELVKSITEDDEEPEVDITPAVEDYSFENFVEQVTTDEAFQQKMFQIYQLYFDK